MHRYKPVPVCIEFSFFLQEFAVNPIANGMSFNIQPAVCVEREFSGEGISLKEISPRNVRGTRHHREIAPGEKCPDMQNHKSVCVAS